MKCRLCLAEQRFGVCYSCVPPAIGPPRVVGVDPSLTSTAICLPDGSTILVQPGKHYSGERRLVYHRQALTEAIAGNVELVVIEAVPTHGAMSIAPLAGLGAVLRVEMYERELTAVDVSPSGRAKFACGDQKSRDKDAVLARAIRAGSSANTNDEADAWWLRKMGVDAYLGAADQKAYQAEALASIDWPELPRWDSSGGQDVPWRPLVEYQSKVKPKRRPKGIAA